MVFENVVVAYDGSDQALAAVKKAAEIVGGEEAAKLHVVFVTTHPNAQLPANFNSASFDPQQYLLSVEDIMALYNKTIDEETVRGDLGHRNPHLATLGNRLFVPLDTDRLDHRLAREGV